MPKNLQALRKTVFRFLMFAALFYLGSALFTQETPAGENGGSHEGLPPSEALSAHDGFSFYEDPPVEALPSVEEPEIEDPAALVTRWYRANSSGMPLEYIPSRFAALRNKYCLSVKRFSYLEIPDALPELLLPFYDASLAVELRLLYENAKEFRRQWIFRDDTVRLTAAGYGSLYGGEKQEDEKRNGFIEIRNSEGLLEREFRFEEDLGEWEYRFFYTGNTLIKAETWYKEPPPDTEPDEGENNEAESTVDIEVDIEKEEPAFLPVSTDNYSYTRSGSIRGISRVLHEGADLELPREIFPRLGPGVYYGMDFASHGATQGADFLMSSFSFEGAEISYSIDSRGRILGETWKDENGDVVGELRNTWSDDRLMSVLWKTDEEERLIEYEYNGDGDRIVERNFNRGVMERSVTSRDGKDVEEIFMNGKIVLRAIWEKGKKISEERVFSSGGSQR